MREGLNKLSWDDMAARSISVFGMVVDLRKTNASSGSLFSGKREGVFSEGQSE